MTAEPLILVPAVEVGASFVHADGTSLAAVPHGEFLMGHGKADNPEHRVILSDYWVYSTEVTNRQYSLCVAQGWCSLPDPDDNPEYECSLGNAQAGGRCLLRASARILPVHGRRSTY